MTNKTDINWETGTFKEHEPIFIEFNNYLERLGINTLFTILADSNYMSIYVGSIKDVRDAKKIILEKSSEIIDKFFALMIKSGNAPKYDRTEWHDYCVNNVYSFEISCIENVVRKNKNEFIEELSNQLRIKPEYVFSHSASRDYNCLPGYYIIFKDAEELSRVDDNLRAMIMIISDKTLRQADKTGFYSEGKIEIKYYDAVTDSKSLYGMSRED